MRHRLHVDIETYSDVDITKAGLYKYVQSPAFDILLIAWALDDGPVAVIDLAEPDQFTESGLREFLHWLYDRDTALLAYNAAFEHYCINEWIRRNRDRLAALTGGHPVATIPAGDWRCVMAHSMYCGYPAGLAAAGEAMGLPQDKKKLSIGSALIRLFCVPHKPDLIHPEPWRMAPKDDPGKWLLFKSYCPQDVETEREIENRLAAWPMPPREQKLWELTTVGNSRGVLMDMDLVRSAITIGEAEQEDMRAEAREITGLDNPNSAPQLRTWLSSRGIDTEDLTKATVADLLAGDLPEDVRRVLELRQRMAKTSTKKYDAIADAACDDGRVRGLMMYYGASRSGRWAGRIVQPQNLPQNHLENLDYARRLAKDGDQELLALSYGSIPDALSQLIRTAFIPRPGCRFAIADYSAIEARVVAWLAGESWVLDAFRAGQDIYCATASQMFGVPVEKHGTNSHLRQRGKVAVLALGYGGGESALEAMGALKMGIPEEDLPGIKSAWRQANPAICDLWRRVEDAAVECVRTGRDMPVYIQPGGRQRKYNVYKRVKSWAFGNYTEDREFMGCVEAESLNKASIAYGRASTKNLGSDSIEVETYYEAEEIGGQNDLKITFRREANALGPGGQEFLTVELPAGRKLFYAESRLKPGKRGGEALSYMSLDQNTKKWGRTDTWGGKLVENITQAVARDCLAETLFRLHMLDLDPVFTVHDEVICEVEDDERMDDILAAMAAPIDWAPGLPLKGAGFCADYYQKD